MSYSNDRDRHSREVRRESYQDSQGNTHTNVTRTTNTNEYDRTNPNAAYRDGYVRGQVNERRIRYEDQVVRDNDNAARGLLLGVLLTSLVGLTVGTLLFLTQRREPTPVAPASPVIVPANPSPAATQSLATTPGERTTIIERRTQEVVPVPQQRIIERAVPVPSPSPDQSAPTTNQVPAPPGSIVVPSPAPQAPTGTSTNPANEIPGGTNPSPTIAPNPQQPAGTSTTP